MPRLIHFLLLVVSLITPAAPTAAQRAMEGLYVTEIHEVASGLELQPDGRFRWAFTMGALDMTAEGRWRVAGDGAVILDTEPAVRPPEAALLGAGREDGVDGLLVRVTDPDGQMPPYLDIEAEYEGGGEPGYAYLDGEYRFDAEPGRRIAAIRILIRFTGYRSEPFAVPAGANVVRLSFAPNDLGRADFRGARAERDGDALLLTVLGEPIRYRQLTAEEQAEYDRMIDDIQAEAGAPVPPEESIRIGASAVTEPVEIAIGEPLAAHVLATLPDYGAGLFATTGPVEALSYRFGGRRIDLGRVGGADPLLVAFNTGRDGRSLTAITFSYQDRLLTLAEALERARHLDGWLRESGFERGPPPEGWSESDPFTATAMTVESAPTPSAGDWDGAARLLGDEGGGIVTMHLFTLKAGEVHASAFVESLRRLGIRDGQPADLPDGREWLLNVIITRNPALLSEEMFQTEE